MRVILTASLILLMCGAYWLGAAQSPILLQDDACRLVKQFGADFRRATVEAARLNVEDLYDRRRSIYGFGNRFSANWYGLRVNAIGLVNWLAGTRFALPKFTAEHMAHAQAGSLEFELVYDLARAFDVSPCETQHLVPRSSADELSVATKKLSYLRGRLAVD